MSLREQLKAALDRAGELAQAATERDLTDDELKEVPQLQAKADELRAKIKAADDAQASLKGLTANTDGTEPRRSPVQVVDRQEAGDAKTFGEAFVKSDAYEAFRKAHPSGLGQGTPISLDRVKVGSLASLRGAKAEAPTLQTGLAQPQPTRLPTVDLTTPQPLTLLDLVSRGTMDGNSFEYVQITAVTRNAAIVADEILPADSNVKPTSGLTTSLADAKAYTYADGYTVTNQMLSDAAGFATYLNSQLGYNINSVVEDKLLNGTGTNGEPFGILNTTGVQQQTAVAADGSAAAVGVAGDIPTTARKAITKLANIGAPVTAFVLSPDDNETLDLMRDANDRYYGQGPFALGPNTLWGRPRIVSQRVQPGQFLVGNLATVTLFDREGLSVLAFNQHKDYAQRNLVYVRGELRAAQAIFQPAQIVVGSFIGA